MAATIQKDAMPQQDSTLQGQRKGKSFLNMMRKGKGKKPEKTRQADGMMRQASSSADSGSEAFSTPKMAPMPQTDTVTQMIEPLLLETEPQIQKTGNALAQMGATLQTPSAPEKDAAPQVDVDVAAGVQHIPTANPSKGGAAEKAKIYYLQAKDGIVEVVASIGDRIVVIRAKVCEVAGVPVEKIKEVVFSTLGQAKIMLNGKVLWVQDGYIYITAAVEGQAMYIKAKACKMVDVAKAKAVQALHVIDDSTAPGRSRAAAVLDSSKARVNLALQPFKPYYVKVHDGIVNIVATVSNTVILVQAKISDVYTGIQVRTVESIAGARAAIEHFSNPLVSRVVSLRTDVAGRVEHLTVSIKGGVVSVRGTLGEHMSQVQTKISELISTICAKTSDGMIGTRKAISDLTMNLVAIVSRAYGHACDAARPLYTKAKGGWLYMACQVNDRVVVLRIKITELVEFLRSKSMDLYSTGRVAIVDTYSGAKMGALRVSEIVKTKSLELGANARSLAGNQKARVTAASAAGGALALGASGGATGLLAGGGVGAGCGLFLAPFTFGLSIPVGAAMGAGTGLCLGTAAGGTAGLVSGGAAGYGVHTHKDKIGNGVDGALSKVKAYKAIAAASTNKLCTQVMAHTGGTAA